MERAHRWSLPQAIVVVAMLGAVRCASTQPPREGQPATFADDVKTLRAMADVIELENGDGGVVAVSPRLSGRVMTSAFSRAEVGFGLVHRPAIEAGPLERGFSNYGGEERFWVAPEGGPFALYFDLGDPQTLEHWYVPPAMDGGPRTVVSSDSRSIQFSDDFDLVNYSGVTLHLRVERKVEVLERSQIESLLAQPLPAGARCVGYRTTHRLSQRGAPDFVPRDQGLAAVWILGQFKPTPGCVVFLPLKPGAKAAAIKDDYFGKVPAERLAVTGDESTGLVARFVADGRHRSKIGVGASVATGWLGAWQPARNVLTLVHHTLAAAGADVPDCSWDIANLKVYEGDVATSYNHSGDPPFFELESLSAAAPASNEPLVHVHHTLHLSGPAKFLEGVAKARLQADLGQP